jgi:hypothetical protein
MIVLQHIPPILSAILLAAHFMRDGHALLLLVCLGMPLLLISPTKTRIRIYQFFLVVGALVWASTAVGIAAERLASGRPWMRMAVIIGVVTLWTLWSAWLFETKRMRKRYLPDEGEGSSRQ